MTSSAVSFDTLADDLTDKLKSITEFDKTKVVIPPADVGKKTQADIALEEIILIANSSLKAIDDWEEGQEDEEAV